ncbi:hypothetical protein QW060_18845 [Myroides ceti]|uniref:Uncharacterized protein n=1 Tax=Paenimyroides ceti TaxID=395087 RepID=A0ABT8CX91_9FLAO|nr:hypothetical protein [Paenimyroides ceti]MDN3708657.1 hypothetical protein [Paenimyroides ceti]MDN3709112.1 hypothetical protein [Paenimyroides ceti]
MSFLAFKFIFKKDVLSIMTENYNLEIEDSYNGKIERKYYDKFNHNASMIKFVDNKSRGIHPYFWGKLRIGDSISKVKGDSVIQVFRNGEKIILEIAPFYEKAIEEQQKK